MSSAVAKNLSRNLAALRKASGFSRQQMADACGMGIDMMRHLEKGTRGHSPALLAGIAHAFGLTDSEVVADQTPKPRRLPAFAMKIISSDAPADLAALVQRAVDEANTAAARRRPAR